MGNEIELPRIFDDKGWFVDPDRSKLPPAVIKQLDKVKFCFDAVKAQEAIIAKCQDAVTSALQAVVAAEELVEPYGKYDFHRLWLETVKQQ